MTPTSDKKRPCKPKISLAADAIFAETAVARRFRLETASRGDDGMKARWLEHGSSRQVVRCANRERSSSR